MKPEHWNLVFSDVDINQMMSDLEQQLRMRVAELGSGVQIVREASERNIPCIQTETGLHKWYPIL